MDLLTDDARYVLDVLRQMRDQVTAKPDLFDPNALRLIEAEIARCRDMVPEPAAARITRQLRIPAWKPTAGCPISTQLNSRSPIPANDNGDVDKKQYPLSCTVILMHGARAGPEPAS